MNKLSYVNVYVNQSAAWLEDMGMATDLGGWSSSAWLVQYDYNTQASLHNLLLSLPYFSSSGIPFKLAALPIFILLITIPEFPPY